MVDSATLLQRRAGGDGRAWRSSVVAPAAGDAQHEPPISRTQASFSDGCRGGVSAPPRSGGRSRRPARRGRGRRRGGRAGKRGSAPRVHRSALPRSRPRTQRGAAARSRTARRGRGAGAISTARARASAGEREVDLRGTVAGGGVGHGQALGEVEQEVPEAGRGLRALEVGVEEDDALGGDRRGGRRAEADVCRGRWGRRARMAAPSGVARSASISAGARVASSAKRAGQGWGGSGVRHELRPVRRTRAAPNGRFTLGLRRRGEPGPAAHPAGVRGAASKSPLSLRMRAMSPRVNACSRRSPPSSSNILICSSWRASAASMSPFIFRMRAMSPRVTARERWSPEAAETAAGRGSSPGGPAGAEHSSQLGVTSRRLCAGASSGSGARTRFDMTGGQRSAARSKGETVTRGGPAAAAHTPPASTAPASPPCGTDPPRRTPRGSPPPTPPRTPGSRPRHRSSASPATAAPPPPEGAAPAATPGACPGAAPAPPAPP